MPEKWQEKFVECLEELDIAVDKLKDYNGNFWVRTKEKNRFVVDKYRDYERGGRNVFMENK